MQRVVVVPEVDLGRGQCGASDILGGKIGGVDAALEIDQDETEFSVVAVVCGAELLQELFVSMCGGEQRVQVVQALVLRVRQSVIAGWSFSPFSMTGTASRNSPTQDE